MARPRIVILGGGFAGYHCARKLSKLMRGAAEITIVTPTDYFLYLPLLPQVTGGLLDSWRVTVSIPKTLPHVGLRLGQVSRIDVDSRVVEYVDPEDRIGDIAYDRLVVAVGSVNRLLPVPGVHDYAHGFRGIP